MYLYNFLRSVIISAGRCLIEIRIGIIVIKAAFCKMKNILIKRKLSNERRLLLR